MTRKGMSLLEVTLASALFLLLVGVAFYVFDYGVRASQVSNTRGNLQTQATRTLMALQADLRRSSYGSLTILSRPATCNGTTVQRDALCFLGVGDWSQPSAFNTTYGVPAFDRYIVYYATTEDPLGRIVRSVYPASIVNCTVTPWSGFDASQHCHNDPNANTGQLGFAVLAAEVRDFTVVEGDNQQAGARLQLMRAAVLTGPSGGRKKPDSSYQMEMLVFPENTWPRE